MISRAPNADRDVDQAPATAPPIVWPIAVDAGAAAAMFHVSARQWWALHSSGRCPLPVRCGRSVRWPVDELRAWAEAGCPSRDAWQGIRDATGSVATSAPRRIP